MLLLLLSTYDCCCCRLQCRDLFSILSERAIWCYFLLRARCTRYNETGASLYQTWRGGKCEYKYKHSNTNTMCFFLQNLSRMHYTHTSWIPWLFRHSQYFFWNHIFPLKVVWVPFFLSPEVVVQYLTRWDQCLRCAWGAAIAKIAQASNFKPMLSRLTRTNHWWKDIDSLLEYCRNR